MSGTTSPEQLTPLQKAVVALKEMKARLQAVEKERTEPLAIIGMGCRVPGPEGDCASPDEFWQMLRSGGQSIREVPPDRWDLEHYYDSDLEEPGKMNTRWGGFLSQIDQFDPHFFGITPREAASLDPQQRLLLEVSWEALEHAGQAPDRLSQIPTGFFIGIGIGDYGRMQMSSEEEIDAYSGTGGGLCFASGRLSYFYRTQGPSLSVDTACSSSLVAVHLACQSLRNRECRLALAGGVNIMAAPEAMIFLAKSRALSPTGRCRTFDAAADGFVRGEGCGLVVLKRLADAQEDGDRILAVIRSSAVNHDGPSSGLTVPNGHSQQILLREALDQAGLEPSAVDYVEAHGTGTSLGDPIELQALAGVYGQERDAGNPLILGSVKTNMGHLEAAAGVSGIIKTVLSLQNREIAPHLHFQNPTPHFDWKVPLEVNTEVMRWETALQKKRLAGVSSFGLSGTNAHVVLEEAPASEPFTAQEEMRSCHLLSLSARDPEALEVLAGRLADHLEASEDSVEDICFTLNTGRAALPHRLAVTATSRSILTERLRTMSLGEENGPCHRGEVVEKRAPRIAFLFSGQGSQYDNMGLELARSQPIFRRVLEECQERMGTVLGAPLLDLMYPAEGAPSRLGETRICQPALFALEMALAELWRSWGIKPDVVLGHSVGEYAAACVAGVMSLDDGLKLIAARGRLMQDLPGGGKMAAIFCDQAKVRAALMGREDRLAIAAINGPSNVVISGAGEAVDEVVAEFASRGVRSEELRVSHAFHSPLMERMLAEFEAVARQISFRSPQIPLVSNVTGTLLGDEIATPDYWVRQVRSAVLFEAGITELLEQKCEIFLEIGPQATLLGMGRRCRTMASEGAPSSELWLPSLRHQRSDWQQLLDSLAEMFVAGVPIDWRGFDSVYPRRKLSLPTYPFQRRRFWLKGSGGPEPLPMLGKRLHPLVHRQMHSPALGSGTIVFESQVGRHAPQYFGAHQIFGQAVVPGTALFEIAAACARQVQGQALLTFGIEDCVLHQPLILPGDEFVTVQTVVEDERGDTGSDSGSRRTFKIFSAAPAGKDSWRLHATGILVTGLEFESARWQPEPYGTPVATDDFFRQAAANGVEFGPDFRALRNVWRREDLVLAEVGLAASLRAEAGDYWVHPVLLDACFQSLGTTLVASGEDRVFLPVGLERLTLAKHPGEVRWSEAHLRPRDPSDPLVADFRLFDLAGRLVAYLEGVVFQRARMDSGLWAAGSRKVSTEWFYRPEWQLPDSDEATISKKALLYLILAEEGGLGQGLVEALEKEGHTCVLVRPGRAFSQSATFEFTVNPLAPEDFRRLVEEVAASHGASACEVVQLWTVRDGSAQAIDSTILHRAQELGSAGTLHLAQALTAAPRSGRAGLVTQRLWVLTRGTQAVGERWGGAEAADLELTQATVWGLGRVFALEHPELRGVRVDLDPSGENDLAAILETLQREDGEDQVAYRRGQRLVARLVRHRPEATGGEKVEHFPSAARIRRLRTTETGILSNLFQETVARRTPEFGEVEIAVQATGLNFKDVLLALGAIPDQAAAEDLLFGSECAGVITALGGGVSGLHVGQEVVAVFAPGCLASHVIVAAEFVVPKPVLLSPQEAATIPVAFLTAMYGLGLTPLGPGKKVLIHAAAGGVGQAAVQLAERAGAEVFATASKSKHPFLEAAGVRHIMDSRTLDFCDEILTATGGRGVDIVLNSFSGEYIPKSLEVLSEGGHFVEIGKVGIWSSAQIHEQRPDVTYHAFDLSENVLGRVETLSSLISELFTAVEEGGLRPLPSESFPLDDAGKAFRYLAQGKNIGKVVLTQQEASPASGPTRGSTSEPKLLEAPEASADGGGIEVEGTYLITGGLGVLGLHTARWLVEQGARHIVLLGRRRPTESAQDSLGLLEEAGAQVLTVSADVTREHELAAVLERIRREMPPLRGIFHAAGMVDDGVLSAQTWERFQNVLAPKVLGAFYLHTLTLDLPLDHFVCFSSIASLLGSPGQGAYAAGNAFLDALAHQRRAFGLPALTINWGSWAGGGMATTAFEESLAGGLHHQIGLSAMEPADCLLALGQLMAEGAPQVGVFPMDWSRFFASEGVFPKLPFYATLGTPQHVSAPKGDSFLYALKELAPSERHERIRDQVRESIAAVLGLEREQVGPRQRLFDLGIDSLMALELRNRLQTIFELRLSQTFIFDHPMMDAIVTFLVDALDLDVAPQMDSEWENTNENLDELGGLSEDEAEELLLQELEKMNF